MYGKKISKFVNIEEYAATFESNLNKGNKVEVRTTCYLIKRKMIIIVTSKFVNF